MAKQLEDMEAAISAMKSRIPQVERFREKTFEVFRSWTKQARAVYPEWEPEVRDEQELLEEMTACFEDAVDSLWKEKHEAKRNIPGWCSGYIAGHVQGALSVAWSVRYLPKSEAYIDALWIKSLRMFFELDEANAVKVNRFFTYLEMSNKLFGAEEEEDFSDYYQLMADERFEAQRKGFNRLLNRLELEYFSNFVNAQHKVEPAGFFGIFEEEDFDFIIEG